MSPSMPSIENKCCDKISNKSTKVRVYIFDKLNKENSENHFSQVNPASVTIPSCTKFTAKTLIVQVGTSGNFHPGFKRSKMKQNPKTIKIIDNVIFYF